MCVTIMGITVCITRAPRREAPAQAVAGGDIRSVEERIAAAKEQGIMLTMLH